MLRPSKELHNSLKFTTHIKICLCYKEIFIFENIDYQYTPRVAIVCLFKDLLFFIFLPFFFETGFKIGINYAPLVHGEDWLFNDTCRSLTSVMNNTEIVTVLDRIANQYYQLYK